MESGSNNEKLKNEEKKNEINYKPLSVDVLRDLLKNSKGIETLWKKIKDNKDGKKSILYKYENDLVELVAKFTEALAKTVEDSKKTNNPIDLGKNLASKENYKIMITRILPEAGEADAFVKKFPHWTIQVGNLFANSVHYRRIASKVSGSNINEANIDSISNFDVAKKIGGKKTGKESKKGFFKSISSFFSKYIKRGGMGKASKSKVTIELAKFGKYVNEPWRRWWETVADSNTELSKKKAKEFLKSALKDQTGDLKAKLVCLFNTGTVEDNKGLEGPYVKLELDEKSGAKVVGDSKAGAVNKMYQIFKAIDAKLGNKAEALFNGAESAKNLDTNDDKINELLKLYNTFKSGKVIKFKRVFELLGIGTNSGLIELTDKTLNNKVDNLFKDSNFSSDKTAKENVTSLAEDAKRFLEAYYKKDTKDKLLYELKFLGSTFGFSELNNVKDVNQAINVLNRAPSALIDILKINDPEVAKKIDEEIAKSAKNIKSLNGALKNLDEEDFNKPENQQTLLNALGAIEKNNLLQLGTSERFEDLTLNNFCNKLSFTNDGKYAKIAGSINNVFKDSKDKKINEFIKELKESLVKQEVKKNAENIQTVKQALKKIKTDVNEQKQLQTKEEVEDAIAAIQTCKGLKDEKGKECTYAARDGRKKFLSDVAQRLGVQIEENKIQDLCISEKDLTPPYDKMPGALLVQKLRNLIGYGLGYGTSKFTGLFKIDGANSLPNLSDQNLVMKICNKLKINIKI